MKIKAPPKIEKMFSRQSFCSSRNTSKLRISLVKSAAFPLAILPIRTCEIGDTNGLANFST
ncbi:hypothetical protein GIB67_031731 [Kingdonia uniflora]|uniref:Uncharacterized protein n=1 Tax=Kingdonia uniflora TaxID=39325 RepID=A0A7J7NKJ0_9MAGN|nr:hypothetical protein GIB67_031731 [Kingdonia uniflora]